MGYILRDEKGVMIANFSADFMREVVSNCKGFWSKYTGKHGDTECYEIIDDNVFFIHGAFKIYLWKGYKIFEENA